MVENMTNTQNTVRVDLNETLDINVRSAGGAAGVTGGAAGGMGGEFLPGAVGADPTARVAAKTEMNSKMKEELALRQANANATRTQANASRQHAGALLGVNMSMLGVMFGMQNMINLAGMRQRQELMELQMKEEKTDADKKRIKELRKEQFEMQKWQARMNAGISLFMILMSVLQVVAIARSRAATAASANAAASLVEARAAKASGNAAFFNAAGHTTAQTAKAGPGAPVVAALIIAGIIAAVTAVVGAKALMAAKGGVISPSRGGQLIIGGEGGETELITPVPMLREIIREETRGRGGVGGGDTFIINAIDTQSFAERRSDLFDNLRRRGQA